MHKSAILMTLALAFATACNRPRTEHSQFVDARTTRFGTKIATMDVYTGKTSHLNAKEVQEQLNYLNSAQCKIDHERDQPAHQGWCAAEKHSYQVALDNLR